MTTKYRRIGNKINRLSSSKNSNLSLVAMFNGFHVAADAVHGSAGVGDFVVTQYQKKTFGELKFNRNKMSCVDYKRQCMVSKIFYKK